MMGKSRDMEEKTIQLDNVSIRYRMVHERVTSFKEYALRWVRDQNTYSYFWALRDISFSVNRGEVIGIIGANGAGKSTLINVVARVLRPTTGRVRVRGTIAPILSLGAGFDPEMTGRENIYLTGAMLGYSRQDMNQKLDGLLDFSGLHEFIDSPLRTYSDGMVARLAFAISTDVNADLLLIDEVLTVGDKDFHKKCIERMSSFKDAHTTILVVSHDLATLEELCSRIIWLEHGRIRVDAGVKDTLKRYKSEIEHPLFNEAQVNLDDIV
jgi:ABC-2 type transport system ATP-binding protein/lipopolysaccharide transport system ATP-binding protein